MVITRQNTPWVSSYLVESEAAAHILSLAVVHSSGLWVQSGDGGAVAGRVREEVTGVRGVRGVRLYLWVSDEGT